MPEASYTEKITERITHEAIFKARMTASRIAKDCLKEAKEASSKQLDTDLQDAKNQLQLKAQQYEDLLTKTLPKELSHHLSQQLASAIHNIPNLKEMVVILTELNKNIQADLISYKNWQLTISRNPFYYFWISIASVVLLILALAFFEHEENQSLSQEAQAKAYFDGVYYTYKTSQPSADGHIRLPADLETDLQERDYLK